MEMITLKKKGGLLLALGVSVFCLDTFASESEDFPSGNELKFFKKEDLPPEVAERLWKRGRIELPNGEYMWAKQAVEEARKSIQIDAEERAILEKMDEGEKRWRENHPFQPKHPFLRTIGRGGWSMGKLRAEGAKEVPPFPQRGFSENEAPQVNDNASEGSSSSGW
ncbi:MAG: hypothetical protein LBG09_00120 [Puniceicoccales bacterium]|jgi:hypothetical protein|nr:hypothetical protein [Puniceicoccales bacterium]